MATAAGASRAGCPGWPPSPASTWNDPCREAPMIRVLLVDDVYLVRAGLRMIIESAPDVEIAGEVQDGAGIVAAVRRYRPDVVLMDIRMPRADGLTATAEVRAMPEPPAVVIRTTFDTDDYLFRALEAGACGFLLKDTPPHDLLRAV